MQIDHGLLDRCKRTDERAYFELYKACYSIMKSICKRYIFDLSEVSDVINRGFLKIINGLGSYDKSRSFEAWSRRIIVNTALDHLRQRKRRYMHEISDPMQQQNGSTQYYSEWNQADLDFDADELLEMVHSLPERAGRIFNLFAIDGYSHEEISQSLEISVGTSKWYVSKAREQLKTILTKKVKEGELL